MYFVSYISRGPEIVEKAIVRVGIGATLIGLAITVLYGADNTDARAAGMFFLGLPGAVLVSTNTIIALLGIVYCGIERHHELIKNECNRDTPTEES